MAVGTSAGMNGRSCEQGGSCQCQASLPACSSSSVFRRVKPQRCSAQAEGRAGGGGGERSGIGGAASRPARDAVAAQGWTSADRLLRPRRAAGPATLRRGMTSGCVPSDEGGRSGERAGGRASAWLLTHARTLLVLVVLLQRLVVSSLGLSAGPNPRAASAPAASGVPPPTHQSSFGLPAVSVFFPLRCPCRRAGRRPCVRVASRAAPTSPTSDSEGPPQPGQPTRR